MNQKGLSLILIISAIAILIAAGVGGYLLGRNSIPGIVMQTPESILKAQSVQSDLSAKFENFSLYQPSNYFFGTTPRGQVYPEGGTCSGEHLVRYREIISKVDGGSKKVLYLFGNGGSGQNLALLITDNYYELDPSNFVSYHWGTNTGNAISLAPGCYNESIEPLYAYPDKLIWKFYECALPVPEEGFFPTQADFIDYQRCRAIENQAKDYFDKKLFDFLAPQ